MSILDIYTIITALTVSFIQSCDSEAVFQTTDELIRKEGYPVRTHRVFTKDGFILTMHRITGSPKLNDTAKQKPVVFLQHGLFSTSADWIILGPEKSLGYLLADEGYDVWMGNARGNRYSRRHTKYKSTHQRYWDFSWHEMGVFDLPAEIDYILRTTGEKKINYVGHSMGTTMFFVLASQKPEYNEKIRHMVALAPIAYMKRTRNALTVLGSALHVAQYLVRVLEKLGIGEINVNNPTYRSLMGIGCSEKNPSHMCTNMLFSMIGFDNKQINKTLLPTLLLHTPDSASLKSLLHYAQQIKPMTHNDPSMLKDVLSIMNPGNKRYSRFTNKENVTQNLQNPLDIQSFQLKQNSQKVEIPHSSESRQKRETLQNLPNTKDQQTVQNQESTQNSQNSLNRNNILDIENAQKSDDILDSIRALNSDNELNLQKVQNNNLPRSASIGVGSLNPFNPHSLLNPLNPENRLNALSLLNPKSAYSPMNPDNPLHAFIDIWVNDTVVFRQFDYYFENKARYGQITPPDYDLKAITTPITLFYGDNDLFTDFTDLILFSSALPNAKTYHVEFKLFNHMDFLWANEVKSLVNDEVIRRLK